MADFNNIRGARFFLDAEPLRLSPEMMRPHMYEYATSGWTTPGSRVSVPPLDVPPAPVEPTPEPESASVQVLRGLLETRRAERKRVEDAKSSRVAQAEEAERRAADLRTRIEGDDRHLSAADTAIADIERDIAALTGLSSPPSFPG